MDYEIFAIKNNNENVSKKYIVIDSEKDKDLFNKINKLQSYTNQTQQILKTIVSEEIDNAIKHFGVRK
jgi:anti-sigma regulatory factor (Ser/Thr protein kinase)